MHYLYQMRKSEFSTPHAYCANTKGYGGLLIDYFGKLNNPEVD